MLKNYFKTAWRTLKRNKFFSLINIIGLTVGLTCFLLICSYLYNELSYDRYAKNANRIYRVEMNAHNVHYPDVDGPVGAGMKNAFPEVLAYTRLANEPDQYVRYKTKQFKEVNIAQVDANFLQLFSIRLVKGNEEKALEHPKSIVITNALAEKYFGHEDPIGKTLIFEGNAIYNVTGVIDKIPARSHFHFDAFISMSSFPWRMNASTWSNLGYYTKNLFGNLLGEPMPRLSDFPLYFICFPVLFVLTLGTVAGIYPAFVLSSLKPVNSVKTAFSGVKERTWLRKVLVSFLFATATIAFIGAIIISKQVNFFLKGELGYNKDYILSAQLPRDWTRHGVDKMITIRNEFSKMPQIKEASLSFEIPDGNNSNNVPIFRYGHDSTEAVSARILENDENFLTLYQIPLAAGDPFKGNRQDSLSVILNETAVNALGWKSPGQAIGQRVRIPGNREAYVIKGVTRDFHFGSMRSKISPVIMFDLQYDFIYRYLSLKLKPGSISSSVNALNKKWSALIPGAPFNYTFMDDTLKNLYETEIRLKRASYTATALALIIVLLGILGLVSLSIKKRTKEIGIRKVLGASSYEVAGLFLKEFLFIVPVAGIVACTLAYTIMQNWLNTFAYRINITPAPFAIAVFLLGLIAAGLIVIQATRVARANPVNSLRSE